MNLIYHPDSLSLVVPSCSRRGVLLYSSSSILTPSKYAARADTDNIAEEP
jgi:hypothetical protein